jgi:hypothetical protein
MENEGWLRDFGRRAEGSIRELRKLEADLKREYNLERDHNERAGLADGVDPEDRSIATKTVHMIAEILANHLMPGFGSLAVNAAEVGLRLVGALGQPRPIEGMEIGLPVTIIPGLVNLNIGTRLYEEPSRHKDGAITVGFDIDVGYNFPSVTIIDESPDHQSKLPPQSDEPLAPETSRPRRMTPESQETGPTSSAKDPHSTEPDGPTSDRDDLAELPKFIAQTENVPESDAAEAIVKATEAPRAESSAKPENSGPSERPTLAAASEVTHPLCLSPLMRSSPLTLWPPSGSAGPNEVATAQTAYTSSTTPPRRDGQSDTEPSPNTPRSKAATGVVICGSANAIAATSRTGYLDSTVVVSAARQAIVNELYDGTTNSVARSVRTVRNLEVVVFLDIDLGICLWIDVNPTSQTPATTLLITITGAPEQPDFACYRS